MVILVRSGTENGFLVGQRVIVTILYILHTYFALAMFPVIVFLVSILNFVNIFFCSMIDTVSDILHFCKYFLCSIRINVAVFFAFTEINFNWKHSFSGKDIMTNVTTWSVHVLWFVDSLFTTILVKPG